MIRKFSIGAVGVLLAASVVWMGVAKTTYPDPPEPVTKNPLPKLSPYMEGDGEQIKQTLAGLPKGVLVVSRYDLNQIDPNWVPADGKVNIQIDNTNQKIPNVVWHIDGKKYFAYIKH